MRAHVLEMMSVMKQYATTTMRAEVELTTKTSMDMVYASECQTASFRFATQLLAPAMSLFAL